MSRNKFDTDEQVEEKLRVSVVLRIFHWIKEYKFQMILSCFIMLVASAISLISPLLIKMAIDDVITPKDDNIKLFFTNLFHYSKLYVIIKQKRGVIV